MGTFDMSPDPCCTVPSLVNRLIPIFDHIWILALFCYLVILVVFTTLENVFVRSITSHVICTIKEITDLSFFLLCREILISNGSH